MTRFVPTGAAMAQSKPADQPKAIGVSQDTANAVNDKAVKNGDAATLVRTGPTAGDRAKQAGAAAKDKAAAAKDKAGDMANGAKDDVKSTTKAHSNMSSRASGDTTTSTTSTTTKTP